MKIEGYLTQSKLTDIVTACGYFNDIKTEVRVFDTRCRWDILLKHNNSHIAIEFDGDQHYRDSIVIRNDHIKDSLAATNNIRVIRIPYYVQMTTQMFRHYFNLDFEIQQDFPHGFITTKVFPASFSRLGMARYESELSSLPINVQHDIHLSLEAQRKKYGDMYV